jgi:hypothetical protein
MLLHEIGKNILAGPASFDHLFDGKSYHRQEMEKVRRRS